MFAAGATLSDPDLQQLIRYHLEVCRQPRREQQRKVAQQAAQMAASGAFDAVVHHSASYASLSSHLWELDSVPLGSLFDEDSAAGDAAAASAAAAAVAAAAAASSNSMCSYTTSNSSSSSTGRGPDSAAEETGSSSGKRHEFGAEDIRRLAVDGSVAAARAVLHPKRLPQLLGLLPDLLAPQRVAVGLALLDSKLRIGEHEVTLGPSCELQGVKTSVKTAGSSDSSAGSASQRFGRQGLEADNGSHDSADEANAGVTSDDGKQPVLLPLLLSLPTALPAGVLDAAAAAAADVVAAPSSRQQLLHAVDTVLAMLTVRAAAKAKTEQAQQQQQQQQDAGAAEAGGSLFTRASAAITAAFTAAQMAVSHPETGVLGTPVVAAAAAAVAAAVAEARSVMAAAAAARPRAVATAASENLQQAAAVASCALGNARSCLAANEAAEAVTKQQQQQQQRRGVDGSSTAELLATLVGLHVSLAGDLWGLWWAYHANVALRLRQA
jgi:hypothetical protein